MLPTSVLLVWSVIYVVSCERVADWTLKTIPGVTIGHERTIKLDVTSKELQTVKTLSINPLIFEVDNFLSDEECEYLIYLAKFHGLQDSSTFPESDSYKTSVETFQQWDVDNDTFIDATELTYIKGKGDIYITELEVMKLMDDLKVDQNNDNKIDLKEFLDITAEKIFEYFRYMYSTKPRLRSRLSKQAWLWHYGEYDALLEGFHERLSRLTDIPHRIIEMSEPMQVVHYDESGHYHCHHDSDEIDNTIPCCTYQNQHKQTCRLCRYLTLLIYLNNVTSGGETAFPVANNKTFDYNAWSHESPLKCNLADNCDKSNLIIKPQKRKALLWYNHDVNKNTGWLGDLNPMTYHGGCDVVKDEKWVANIWINAVGEQGSNEAKRGWLGKDLSNKDEL